MNREDIIRMAQDCWPSDRRMWSVDADLPRLERFAALVAAASEAKEREACALIAEKQRYAMHISLTSHPVQNGTAVGIANAIRARGQA